MKYIATFVGVLGILCFAGKAHGDATVPRRARKNSDARGRAVDTAPADVTIPLSRSRHRTATFQMSGGVTAYDIKINAYEWRRAKSSAGVDGNAVVGIGRVRVAGIPMLANVYRAGPSWTHGVAHTTRSNRHYNPTPHNSVRSVYIARDRTDYWGPLRRGTRANISNVRKVDPSGLYQKQSRHANWRW